MLTINQRHFSLTLPLTEELQFESNQNYVFALPNYAVLEVSGEKALEFLQGQLTCNVYEVNQTTMRQGAQCNLKGRILALMDVVSWNNRLFLILPSDLLEPTRLTLQKTAMFSRVSLKPQPSIHVHGLYIQNESNTLFELPQTIQGLCATSEYCCYRLTKMLFVLLTQAETSLSLNATNLTTHFAHRGELAWHALSLQAGLMSIYPNSRGLFLPHHLGLHQTNTISFEKGCYKGQEIIARMHYRAKLKHQTQLVFANTTEELFAGQKIFDKDKQQDIGELIDFCPYPDNQYLMLISTSKPELCSVHLEQHQQNLTLSLFK